MGLSIFGQSLTEEILRRKPELNIAYINERFSTLEARKLFWKDNQPNNLWWLIPATLRPLPRPIDDYAAVVLGQRYLKS
jgi:RNase H-fold protein (predicted Holliday junction resolvase)